MISKSKILVTILSIIIAIIMLAFVALYFAPKPPLLNNVSFSRAVYDKDRHLLRLTLSHDEKYRLFTPLTAIPPQLIDASLLQEDQYFYWHFGVNPIALFKAGWKTYVLQERRVGASTITMQLARMSLGINSKILSGKIQQIIRALQLEMHYSKKQILEAYLNLAPYGNNIEGVGAASLIYFSKPVNQLTLPEILTLVVIPQNPSRRIFVHNASELKKARNLLFQRWLEKFPQDAKQKALMELPMNVPNFHKLPFLAPHLVDSLLKESHSDSEFEIATTLNLKLQNVVEKATKNYLMRKKNLGVENAAVMLVDARDMTVKVMLGSADFFNSAIGGQINGTLIKRSPGSTLKPFIYALALDQGLIHPATVLKDVPSSFGAYNPENFDRDFMGPLSAREALILSRNIPALYLANQLSEPNLYQFLQQADIEGLKSASFYGLAMVLGGIELSMQDLVSLYAVLVNEGVWRPLRVRLDQPLMKGRRLLSPEASFLVLDMLKDTPRPAGFNRADKQQNEISWKTGTSSGYRDAWTIGVFGQYVLAVWVGNFDNSGNHALVGKDIAAPLFFTLVEAISPLLKLTKSSRNFNLNLTKVKVCQASGMLPNRSCSDLVETWFIPGKSPIKKDTIYREIPIDEQTGLRACRFDENTIFKTYEFWPSDLLNLFEQAGVKRHIPPPYDKNCSNVSYGDSGIAPQITSPKEEVKYILRYGANGKEAQTNIIPFAATTDADVKVLHWFVNTSYVGKSQAGQAFWWQSKPGNFVVRVIDDHGRSAACDLHVELTN